MIYFGLFFLLLLVVDISGGSKIIKTYASFKYGYILLFFAMLILIGARDMYVGTDTATYVYDFLGADNIEWLGIKNIIKEYPEPLYEITKIFCRTFTDNYTIFLFVFAFPISFCFSLYVKKYSDDYMISMLIFMVLGILGFCMAGLRQSVALALSLFAYGYARDRKLIPFLLCCIVAFGFHNSSMVILVMYPLFACKKINFKWWIAVFVAFVIGYTKNGIVMNIASFFFTQDRYNIYATAYKSSLNYTMLIIQGVLLLFCYSNRFCVLREDKRNASLYIMAFIGMIFQSFTPILGEFFRLSMFFSVSLCILVPKTIALMFNGKLRVLSYYGIVALSVVYMLLSGSSIFNSYVPFWT